MNVVLWSTSFPGMDGEFALTITALIAGLWLTFAILAVVFFAWAPHLSDEWRAQFGTGLDQEHPEESSPE